MIFQNSSPCNLVILDLKEIKHVCVTNLIIMLLLFKREIGMPFTFFFSINVVFFFLPLMVLCNIQDELFPRLSAFSAMS